MKTINVTALAFLLAFAATANAQTLADYQFSTGHDNSRWVVLDSTRNLLVDGSEYYRRSYLENIGFDFPFADTVYSQFSVTLAGDLRLGGTRALTSGNTQGSPFHPTRAALNKPKINFFGCTGYVSDSAYVHRQVFGEYPDRVLVVDFALQTFNTSSRPSLFRYQVHLHENGDIEVVYPSQVPPRMPAVQRMQGLCYDENDVWIVDNNHVATHYVGGCSSYVPSDYWPDTNRYYRFEYPNGVCQMPTDFLAEAGVDTIALSWYAGGDETQWQLSYGDTTLTTSTPSYVARNLAANTEYLFFVAAICSEGDTSETLTGRFRTLPRPQDSPDTVECLVPSGVGYYQDTPWAYHEYEFHFYWSGDAPAYEVAINCLNLPTDNESRFVVEDTVFFFDAQGRGANWTMTVRSLCSDSVSSGWSDTVEFDTPLCVGVETPGTESGIALYPNPSKGRSTLLLSGMEGMVDVRVVDLNGRLKEQYSVDCSSQSTQALLLDGLATGTYFVRVAGSDAIVVRKLVVR